MRPLLRRQRTQPDDVSIEEARKRTARGRFDREAQDAQRQWVGGDAPQGSAHVPAALRAPYVFLERLIEQFGRDTTMLDYGAGRGIYTITSARAARMVIAVDISPASLRVARDLCSKSGMRNCHFVVADCERLPFSAGAFSCVLSAGTLSYVTLATAVDEFHRTVAPGGTVLIVDTLGHNPLVNIRRWFRARFGSRSAWEVEHVPKMRDVETLLWAFPGSEVRFFDLVTLALALFPRRMLQPTVVLRLVARIDAALLNHTPLRYLAFKFVMVLRKP